VSEHRKDLWSRRWPVFLLGLGAASALWPWLGLPAAFASLIGVVALRRPDETQLPHARLWIAAGALASSVGVARFVVEKAMLGIVGGGRTAVEQRAVSRLRDVLFAEDAMRRAGWIDPDGDGVGSAAYLAELCGGLPQQGQPKQPAPVLECGELVDTPIGAAARSGPYLYTVCLPLAGGGWSARPGAPVDTEAAERRFVAYAWPEPGSPFSARFFIDEHDGIRVSDAAGAPTETAPPSCDAAFGDPPWPPWRDKKPRSGLPGVSAGASGGRPGVTPAP